MRMLIFPLRQDLRKTQAPFDRVTGTLSHAIAAGLQPKRTFSLLIRLRNSPSSPPVRPNEESKRGHRARLNACVLIKRLPAAYSSRAGPSFQDGTSNMPLF